MFSFCIHYIVLVSRALSDSVTIHNMPLIKCFIVGLPIYFRFGLWIGPLKKRLKNTLIHIFKHSRAVRLICCSPWLTRTIYMSQSSAFYSWLLLRETPHVYHTMPPAARSFSSGTTMGGLYMTSDCLTTAGPMWNLNNYIPFHHFLVMGRSP